MLRRLTSWSRTACKKTRGAAARCHARRGAARERPGSEHTRRVPMAQAQVQVQVLGGTGTQEPVVRSRREARRQGRWWDLGAKRSGTAGGIEARRQGSAVGSRGAGGAHVDGVVDGRDDARGLALDDDVRLEEPAPARGEGKEDEREDEREDGASRTLPQGHEQVT